MLYLIPPFTVHLTFLASCLFQKTVVSMNKQPVLVVTEFSSHTGCQNFKGIKDKSDINNSFGNHAPKLTRLTYALLPQLFSLHLNTLVHFTWVLSALCIGMYFLHFAVTRGQNSIELQGRRQWMKRICFTSAKYTCMSVRMCEFNKETVSALKCPFH